jgi:hypothetical protein
VNYRGKDKRINKPQSNQTAKKSKVVPPSFQEMVHGGNRDLKAYNRSLPKRTAIPIQVQASNIDHRHHKLLQLHHALHGTVCHRLQMISMRQPHPDLAWEACQLRQPQQSKPKKKTTKLILRYLGCCVRANTTGSLLTPDKSVRTPTKVHRLLSWSAAGRRSWQAGLLRKRSEKLATSSCKCRRIEKMADGPNPRRASASRSHCSSTRSSA